jgi:GrpB-like predicted nucleotidyltransferase (UPF0157 family)/mannose-6-phosphate isomerase-like protein (cupin superfamily)
MPVERPIGPYEHRPAACLDHDPRAAEVTRRVGELVAGRLPGVAVEHVGSTSVPGCPGKGVVDLMVLYPPGELARTRDALDAMGFQRQGGPDPWPEDRPMRVGSLDHDGDRFLLHAHVVAADAPEVAELRAFRDRLRADPDLVARYAEHKRVILASGVTDTRDYCLRKGEFVTEVLRPPSQSRVNLREKFASFGDHWSPRIVAELNGQHVKLVKLLGEFVWHRHEREDELFLVVKGRFRMEFRDRHEWVGEGEFLVVPRGVEHRPVAEEEAHVLLFEPATTLNTGDVRDERTVDVPERI